MRKRGLTGDFWPSRKQELLLRAALLDEEPALAAWRELRPTLDIDRLEEGSFALLPLVYRRLQAAGVEDPSLGKLRGIYRHTWSRNQLALDRLKGVLRYLERAGVEAIPVRGASTLLRYYPEIGLRPMTEFELLVRERDAGEALRLLGRVGWSPADSARRLEASGWPALRLRGADGHTFVLHWRLLPEFDSPAAENGTEELFEAGFGLEAYGVGTRTLSPADELLHSSLTGARSAPFTNIQWIADSSTIVAATPDLDWGRLVEQANRRRAGLRMRDALTYLAGPLDVPVPNEVLRSLPAEQPTKRDVVAHKIGATGGKVAGEMPRALAQYIRSTTGRGALRTTAGVPRFLRDSWNLNHYWEMPLFAVRKGVSRLAARRRHASSA